MNERIKELASEAEDYADGIVDQGGEFHPAYTQKLAELIVKECGQWFNNRLVVEPDYGFEHRIERNRAVVGVMKEYNEHFGVEE
jgi:hypothetical protein